MKIHRVYKISEEFSGKRVDQIAYQLFPQVSRSQWKNSGDFFLQDKKLAPSYKVKFDQEILFVYEEDFVDLSELVPWDYPLAILEESDDFLVVDKPVGISVHPSVSENSQQTMVNALVHYLGKNISDSFDVIENREVPRPGIVHRLDKTTSGVLLVAKNNRSHRFFQANWKDFRKFYYAIVEGKVPEQGEILGGIMRDPKNRYKMAVTTQHDPSGKPAHTKFFREKYCERQHLSLVKIELLTGRTHQIRAHFSSINFPLLGDEIYGGKKSQRIFLHATELQFTDPNTRENRTISTSLPSEFPLLVH